MGLDQTLVMSYEQSVRFAHTVAILNRDPNRDKCLKDLANEMAIEQLKAACPA